jgi:hypothetical protein
MTEKKTLNLTITAKPSQLNNLTLKEPISMDILDKLMRSDLLKETFNNPFSEHSHPNEYEQLKKYKKLIKNGYAYVKYNKVNGIDYGRVNPKGALGLFSIRREVRQTLAKDKLVDIDIENAHPVMLLQICEHNKIECSTLKKYVNNRTKYLEMVQKTYLSHIEDKNKLKDSSKSLFIRLLYFGEPESWFKDNNIEFKDIKENFTINKFIFSFQKELNEIGDKIIEKNTELSDIVKKRKQDQNKKKYNLKGSVVSYFLQEYENQILETMYTYCVFDRYITNNVAVLCADGFMITKEKFKPSLLEELQNEVFEKTGFKIKLTQKEMTQDYLNILDDHIKIEEYEDEEISEQTYSKAKEKFEKHSFKVKYPLMYITINDDNVYINDKTKFSNLYENIIYNGKYQFIKDWFKDPENKSYEKIDFKPNQETPSNIFNTFRGYVASKLPKQELNIKVEETLIYKHLFNICGCDNKVMNYTINFLARKLQKPYKLTNTALLFKSIPGVGKDTFFNWFGNKILGKQYYFNEDCLDQIFGIFNPLLANKILVIINETSGKDTKDVIEKIKNGITREVNTINPKGLQSYENQNNIGYIFLTNNDNPLQISMDDRRFQVIQCNDKIANNGEYFNELYNEIEGEQRDKISRLFYDYLMNIDCDSFDFTNERILTEVYEDMKEQNKPIIINFLENFVKCNVIKDKETNQIKMKEPERIQGFTLYDKFNGFLMRNGYKFDVTKTKFGLDIKKYKGITKKDTNKGILYTINYEELKNDLIDKKYMKWDNNMEVLDKANDDDDE